VGPAHKCLVFFLKQRPVVWALSILNEKNYLEI